MACARLGIRSILSGALLSLAAGTGAATEERIVGAAPVKLEFARGPELRMGLVIGSLPQPVEGHVVLLPHNAIYSSDLQFPRAVKNLSEREGQILELPAIDLPASADTVRSLHAVWLPWRGDVGTAACIGRVQPGNAIRIATLAAGASEPAYVAGQVLQAGGDRFQVSIEKGVRLGDPVFVDSGFDPKWRALGIVTSAAGPGRAWVASLRAIFRGMPPESTWALHPLGLCDGVEGERGMQSVSSSFKPLFLSALKDIFVRDSVPDIAGLRTTMQKHWPGISGYLARPGIEHYYFSPRLPPDAQMDQFWQSMVAIMDNQMGMRTPAGAIGPAVRIRTRLGEEEPARGWAVALSHLKSGSYSSIVLVTANHLVEPVGGKERDVQAYFPFLQGFGLPAKRFPVADRALDLAVLVVNVPEKAVPRIFDIFWTACPASLAGPVDVPLNAWGWRRERLRGTLHPGERKGEIRITGLDAREGFSGGVILKNGIEIAGILTRHVDSATGATGASVDAMLRLVALGKGPRQAFGCQGATLEQRAAQLTTMTLLKRERPARADATLAAALFGEDAAARLRIDALPALPSAQLGRNAPPTDLEGRCTLLRGQSMVPQSQAFLEQTAPRGPDGRPTIKPADTVGCELPVLPQGAARFALRNDIAVPFCLVSAAGERNGVPLLYSQGRFWDAEFLMRCEQPAFGWYEPAGWIEEAARHAPPRHLVQSVPEGSFTMGPCENVAGLGREGIRRYCDGWVDVGRHDTFVRRTDAYRISKFPVTVEEYARCVADGNCKYTRPDGETQLQVRRGSGDVCNWGRPGVERHPMNCISWPEASQFCAALGGRLPTETEWEKAARGTDGRRWPWKLPNAQGQSVSRELLNGTMAVGLLEEMASPYGLQDIAFHVSEWTGSAVYGDPAALADLERRGIAGLRVTRGEGGTSNRSFGTEREGRRQVGFRCVFAPGK
jgi:formylglycine-generating enzyme required for sulfatase activity